MDSAGCWALKRTGTMRMPDAVDMPDRRAYFTRISSANSQVLAAPFGKPVGTVA